MRGLAQRWAAILRDAHGWALACFRKATTFAFVWLCVERGFGSLEVGLWRGEQAAIGMRAHSFIPSFEAHESTHTHTHTLARWFVLRSHHPTIVMLMHLVVPTNGLISRVRRCATFTNTHTLHDGSQRSSTRFLHAWCVAHALHDRALSASGTRAHELPFFTAC
jgi:hypothetical protein